jgi:geranylgeranyl diphosphate synthase type II
MSNKTNFNFVEYLDNYKSKRQCGYLEYIKMIGLKTSVLLAGSMKIGAIIGGAREEDAHHIYEFGKNLGIAFQLQDDILDVFGCD